MTCGWLVLVQDCGMNPVKSGFRQDVFPTPLSAGMFILSTKNINREADPQYNPTKVYYLQYYL